MTHVLALLSVLTGQRHECSAAELQLLLALPAESLAGGRSDRHADVLRELTRKGLLIGARQRRRGVRSTPHAAKLWMPRNGTCMQRCITT